MKHKAIVIGGSRGIGKAICDSLTKIGCQVTAASRADIDTSDLASVKAFADFYRFTDVLVLNTGGPPKKSFFEISVDEWSKYHNQLFLGFCVLLQNLKINPGGYIFLISSHLIKKPDETMVLSCAYRVAFWAILKSLTKQYSEQGVSCINIAPGPIKTDRLVSLATDMTKLEERLPLKRAGRPAEIGDFVRAVVEHDIKYINGSVVSFDGGLSAELF